jgi:hypothetical protein
MLIKRNKRVSPLELVIYGIMTRMSEQAFCVIKILEFVGGEKTYSPLS